MMDGHREERILDGVKVLDFTRFMAGPWSTRLLKDLGAYVIKVEHPETGCEERGHPQVIREGYSGHHMQQNVGKKSLTINLKHPKGIAIIKKLVATVDVLVENFRPGTMEKLGLGYSVLKEINPGLIMCSVSCFGQTGSYAHRPGFGIVAEAMSGAKHMVGYPDMAPPIFVPAFADGTGALHAFGAIGHALYYREKTGKGQHIDIALTACMLFYHDISIEQHILTKGEAKPIRVGSQHPMVTPYGVFKVKDKYIVIGAGSNNNVWRGLCRAMGKGELAADENYDSIPKRTARREEVVKIINDWLEGLDSAQTALTLIEKEGVPCAPVLSIEELVDHPYFEERGMFVEVDDPVVGKVKVLNTPLRFSGTTAGLMGKPALLGEHNEEVLSELLGYTSEGIQQLKSEGVLGITESLNNPN